MSSNDPSYMVGGLVHAKAWHVTSESECRRRYGSHAKTKLLNGVVTEVDTIRNGNNKRNATEITAFYTLGGRDKKVRRLNLRRVKAGHVAAINSNSNGPVVTELVTENRNTLQSTDDAETALVVGISTDERIAELLQSSDEELERAAEAAGAPAAGVVAIIQQQQEGVRSSPQRRETRTTIPPVADVHGIQWFQATDRFTLHLNGNVPWRQWSIRTPVGETLIPGRSQATTNDMSPIDFFLLMFPPKQLLAMVRLSNTQLDADTFAKTNTSEMLKFFGVIILTTKFEFTSRRSLWNTVATSKYRPAPHFGQTGMSRNRFEELFKCVRWSHQPPQQGAECSETYRWKLVDDFVTNFNDHRADHCSPSDCICVDESMSRWYGQGGHWINHGLPQYIAIDRKPENGCEIQNAACGESGVMLRLKLVKGVDLVNDEDDGVPTKTSLLHGTNVLLNVVSPWFGSHRIVCADSYFASVGAANELYKHGLRFIGVVKTATKGFPKSYLSGVELERRGDFRALTTAMPANVGDPQVASFVWMDCERRYFIATAGSQQAGTPYTRCRWRQVSDEPNALPQIAEIYYSTCSAIDKHNRLRQDDLRIEKKVETVNWSTRVNLSIFAMIVVDSWLVYNAFTQGRALNQKEFYSASACRRAY